MNPVDLPGVRDILGHAFYFAWSEGESDWKAVPPEGRKRFEELMVAALARARRLGLEFSIKPADGP